MKEIWSLKVNVRNQTSWLHFVRFCCLSHNWTTMFQMLPSRTCFSCMHRLSLVSEWLLWCLPLLFGKLHTHNSTMYYIFLFTFPAKLCSSGSVVPKLIALNRPWVDANCWKISCSYIQTPPQTKHTLNFPEIKTFTIVSFLNRCSCNLIFWGKQQKCQVFHFNTWCQTVAAPSRLQVSMYVSDFLYLTINLFYCQVCMYKSFLIFIPNYLFICHILYLPMYKCKYVNISLYVCIKFCICFLQIYLV